MILLIKRSCRSLLSVFALLLLLTPAQAVIQAYEFDEPEQREMFNRLNEELRCPMCQNQSIADSNAPIAQDLRREVHRLLTEEKADEETVIEFMLARYGDFVLYRPKMEARTLVLWFGPLALLLLGLFILFRLLKRHQPQVEDQGLSEQDQAALKNILNGKDHD